VTVFAIAGSLEVKMADLLSLIANVVAVMGAATRISETLQKLKSFNGAPDQLLQVINEVLSLQLKFGILC